MLQVREKKLPRTVFTPNQHYMNHLPKMITKLGSPIEYSTRSLERTIGNYKSRIRSRTDPGAESSKQLVELAATNHRLLEQQFDNDVDVDGYKLNGKITKTAAQQILTQETMAVIGAQQNDFITSSMNLSRNGTTYHSTSSRNNTSRINHMLVFKVKVQR